jgi:hypothetical protein
MFPRNGTPPAVITGEMVLAVRVCLDTDRTRSAIARFRVRAELDLDLRERFPVEPHSSFDLDQPSAALAPHCR